MILYQTKLIINIVENPAIAEKIKLLKLSAIAGFHCNIHIEQTVQTIAIASNENKVILD